jgi:hypothetical protein
MRFIISESRSASLRAMGMIMLFALMPMLEARAYATTSPSEEVGILSTPQSSIGSCARDGNITLTIAGQTRTGEYFVCSGAPVYTSNSTGTTVAFANGTVKHLPAPGRQSASSKVDPKFQVKPDYSSNVNYQASWSSGSCNTSCTSTDLTETSTMAPNTAYWSIQDNAYSSGTCGGVISYQDVPEIGTSSNSYNIIWDIETITYPLCGATNNHSDYSFLNGTNLNSGESFITWYTINSGGTQVYSTQNMPGVPNQAIVGWEEVVVCGGTTGCNTNFTGGAGNMTYYQSSISIGSGNSWSTTSETSNCSYSSITSYTSYATQTYSC